MRIGKQFSVFSFQTLALSYQLLLLAISEDTVSQLKTEDRKLKTASSVRRDGDERGRVRAVGVAEGRVEFGLHVAGGRAQVLKVEERGVEQVAGGDVAERR